MKTPRMLVVAVAGLFTCSVATLLAMKAEPEVAPTTTPSETNMTVTVRTIDETGKLTAPHPVPKFVLSDAEWRKRLTKDQYDILRSSSTERPFCGGLLNNKESGLYVCAGCNLPLFKSDAKFESGTGWPSFYQPVVPENVATKSDTSHGMERVEINCARCDGHLGHVFEDGPKPTGLRYCLNSESLKFVKNEDLKSLAEPAPELATTQPTR